MSRRIGIDMTVDLTWETLLGLDKEAREIRDLCQRRGVAHFVLLTDEFGLRNAGLVSLDEDPSVATGYTLAGILAARAAGKSMAFLHSVPEADDLAVVICVKSGRPELDRVLPREEAMREANLFLESLDDAPSVFGDILLPGITSESMTLPDAGLLTDAERLAHKVHALSAKRSLKIGKPAAMASAAVVALCGTVGIWAMWPETPTPRTPTPVAAPVDPVATYLRRVHRELQSALTAASHERARRIHAMLGELPLVAGQWRVRTIDCRENRCNALWQRDAGGTLDSLLVARPSAILQETNLDEAIETVAVDMTFSPIAPAPLRVIPRDVFYLRAGSRTQTLRDNKIEVELAAPAPLLPVPAGLSADDPRIAALPLQGHWHLAGHLAFVDSVGGLLERTGNMRLDTVVIDIDPAGPRFRAEGKFYVE